MTSAPKMTSYEKMWPVLVVEWAEAKIVECEGLLREQNSLTEVQRDILNTNLSGFRKLAEEHKAKGK